MRMLSLVLLPIAVLPLWPAGAQQADTSAAAPPQMIDPSATVDGLPIGALPQQRLPAKGCAAFLWSRTPSMALVAMATADPGSLRLSLDGKTVDYPISAQNGIGGLGFSQITEYRGAGVLATLQGNVRTDAGAPNSGSISDGILRIERAGRAAIVIPVAGAIGCA